MPHKHNRQGRSVHTSVTRLQQDRGRTEDTWDRASVPAIDGGCIAHARCERPVMPAAPVALCAHHLREVYVFAQDLISERLIPVVDELVAEYQQSDE